MSWRFTDGGFPSGFRDSLRFGSSSWASSAAVDGHGGGGSGSGSGNGNGSSRLQGPRDGCSYTKTVRSRCFISDGKPVKKCEKTEQILRNCVGRPQEIVESKSEYTEEEVPNGWTLDSSVEEEKGIVPFPFEGFPGVPSPPWRPFEGTDPFKKGLSDGIESFMKAAENMMNDAFNQLGFYRRDEGSDGNNFHGIQEKASGGRRGRNLGEGPPPPEDSVPSTRKVDFTDSRSFDEV